MLQDDHKIQEREKILDWISTFDNESKHDAIRMPRVAGTGEWLTDTEEFKTWRMSVESPSVLWCTYRRKSCLPFPDRSLSHEICLENIRSLDVL